MPNGQGPHPQTIVLLTADAFGVLPPISILEPKDVMYHFVSGFTARVVSSFRPPVPILALTDSRKTYNQLALIWGVVPVLCDREATFQQMLACAREMARPPGHGGVSRDCRSGAAQPAGTRESPAA